MAKISPEGLIGFILVLTAKFLLNYKKKAISTESAVKESSLAQTDEPCFKNPTQMYCFS